MNRALIFDCDGVLAETEKHGHLPAFNQMWKEFGVPWQWTAEQYGQKLKIGGGKERMASLFRDPEFTSIFTPPDSDDGKSQLLRQWHQRKSEIYAEIIATGQIPPRSGVRRLAESAMNSGWKLAVASTSAQASVEAVLKHVVGSELASHFLVLGGDVAKAKKPAPDIYRLTATKLDISPANCVAIEDSENGVTAAVQAEMKCVVTQSEYTHHEDFSRASLVLTCLGDPNGEVCKVLTNRSMAQPAQYLAVVDLESILGSSIC